MEPHGFVFHGANLLRRTFVLQVLLQQGTKVFQYKREYRLPLPRPYLVILADTW